MKEIITKSQKSEMGSGFGYLKFKTNTTLEQVLKFYSKNNKSWGTITIFNKNKKIERLFDYDTYNNNKFYHNLNHWFYSEKVDKVEFSYCYMNKDIIIYLK